MHSGHLSLVLATSLVLGSMTANAPGSSAQASSANQVREVVGATWRITSFIDDAGLAGRFIFQLAFDAEGNAWIATSVGLYSFDGYTWTGYTQKDGLPSDLVRCVVIADDGNLWIGTDNGIAVLNEQGRILIPENQGLAGPNVRRIVQDRDGTLWFCSDTWLNPNVTAGLASFRDGQWKVYRKSDGLPSDYVSDYFRDSQGRQFVLTQEGLAQKQGETWIRPLEELGLAGYDKYFWSIAEVPSIGVFAATKAAFFILKDGRWTRVTNTTPGLNLPKIASISAGELMTLPSSHDKRFLVWSGGEFVPESGSFRDPGEPEYLAEAPDGSIWAAGYNMLVRWVRTGGEWTEYTSITAPLLADQAGRVWFASDQALIRREGEQWESFPVVVSTVIPGRGTEVFGIGTSELIKFSEEGITRYGPGQTGIRRIHGHAQASDGTVWLHGVGKDGRNTISTFDGEAWTVHAPAEIQGGRIARSRPDLLRGVWYLVSEGSQKRPRLVHIDGKIARTIPAPEVATGYVPGLHVDYQGRVWLHGYFGLFVLADGSWEKIEGIPGTRVYGSVNGDRETWFAYYGVPGGKAGLGCFCRDSWSYFDMDGIVPVRKPGASSRVFFRGLGTLQTTSKVCGAPPRQLTLPFRKNIRSVVEDPEGNLWMGTGSSVYRYRPDRIPPQTAITKPQGITFEGDALAVTLQGIERFKPRGSTRHTYSWRVNGGPWTDFEPAPKGMLPLALGTGKYVLEARARDEGLDVDPTPARTPFSILAMPLQQRWWFWPITGALFATVAFLAVIAIAAWRRARFWGTNLERIVDERTADLRESELRFRALTTAVPLPIAISRLSDGLILYTNSLFQQRFAPSEDSLVGRRIQDFFEHPSERTKILADLQKTGWMQGREIEARTSDGTPFWCLVSLQTLTFDGEPALIEGCQDITLQKRAAKELEAAHQAAESANRTKSIFLGNLSHEVRTPIMAMIGAAEAQVRNLTDPATGFNPSDVILRNSQHLLSLFDNLLDLASLEAGKFAVHPTDCSLPEILANVHSVTHALRSDGVVEFGIFFNSPIPSRIRSDPVRLAQALINLISNALKFTTHGHVRIHVSVDRNADEPRLSFAVEDTGPGIPEADLRRIFQAFEQAAPSPQTSSSGVGLGLPLAQWIAGELGGDVIVQSQLGQGSTFTLSTNTGPLGQAKWITPDGAGSLLEADHTNRESAGLRRIAGTVLVAEDAPDARELIARALRNAGATVVAVENGQQALEAATNQTFDLVLMDVRMPVLDGIAATIELRRRGLLIPIIALTASAVTGDYAQIIEQGFDDLWPKPISLTEITRRACSYLATPKARTSKPLPSGMELGQAGSSDSRQRSVVADFVQGLPSRVQAIKTAVSDGDLGTARELLHQLAGTGGIMGFPDLSEEAGQVLSIIRNGKGQTTAVVMGRLETIAAGITVGSTEPDPPSGF